MSTYLGTLIITTGNNSFGTPNTGIKGIIVGNASGLSVVINMDGTGFSKTLYPSTVDFFPVERGYSGTIKVTATADMTNTANWPGSFLRFDAIGWNEFTNLAAYPMQLPPPAVSTSASGRVRYSASVSVASTATKVQRLTVFNPINSGMNYVFDSARFSTSDAGVPEVDLSFVTPDLAFATPVTVTPHTIGAPASKAKATFIDSIAGVTGTTQVEIMDANISAFPQDFLEFPDSVTVTPGNGILITINGTATAKAITETAKWTEVPI